MNLNLINNTEHIGFYGKMYSAKKGYHNGTHRSCSPEDTLERVRPLLKIAGVTRLSDITGLDRIGIPVIASIRPNALSVTTSCGKGISTAAALTSGAMESLEIYNAENINIDKIHMSYEEVCEEFNVPSIENLALSRESLFNTELPEEWVTGWDIINQTEVTVPWLSVTMGSAAVNPSEYVSFQVSSNGLSSGNNFLEAVSSGLFEVIERDAIACRTMANAKKGISFKRVRLETIENLHVVEILEKFRRAEVMPVLYDFTVDTEVPVYQAYIYDLVSRKVGRFKGYGAHLDPAIAMLRALTEAAQSRVVLIAGSRDDIFKSAYTSNIISDTSQGIERLENREEQMVDARERKSLATDSFEGDIQVCLEKLLKAGLKQAVVFDITLPSFNISVVRVVVPGLEGYRSSYQYAPGYRALNFKGD